MTRFFNDAFHDGLFPGFWRLLRSSYDGDTYGHLPLKSKFLDQIVRLTKTCIDKKGLRLVVRPRLRRYCKTLCRTEADVPMIIYRIRLHWRKVKSGQY